MRPSTLGPALVALVFAAAGCAPAASPPPTPTDSVEPHLAASQAPSTATTRIPLVIDTDMAPDDVTAIASLIRDPRVEVLGITVVGTGEAHCAGGMSVVRSLLTMLEEGPLPVACGRASPMGDAQAFPDAWRAGADAGSGLRLVSPGFAPDPRSAEQVLVDLAVSLAGSGQRLTILTLGTLTNVATAVALDPSLPGKVRLVSMLGAVSVPGNVRTDDALEPTAEWNAHADPTAVRLVLEAGFDWTLVPLDATNHTPLTRELAAALETDHVAGPADLVYELWSANPYMTAGDYYLWDPLAAAVLRDPTIASTRPASIRVIEGDGHDGGRLVEDAAGRQVTIATGANRARFEDLLLSSLRVGRARSNPYVVATTIRVTVGPSICDVEVDPPIITPGPVHLEASTSGPDPGGVVVFTSDVAWSDIEARFSPPDPEHWFEFELTPVVSVGFEPGVSGSAVGEVVVGPLGVVCATTSGPVPTPPADGPVPTMVLLRGPFEVTG